MRYSVIIVCILIVHLFLICKKSFTQGFAINVADSMPHPSAILDISSEDKGILIPRIELSGFDDVISIPSPAKGLLVFNSVDTYIPEGFYYWDGSIWKQLSVSSTSWNLIGNESINPASDFLGTKDNNAFIIKTNDTSRVFVSPIGNVGIGTNNPTQQLQITNSLSIPKTSSSSVGVVYKEDVVFIHNYKHPNADTHENTFVGMNSGNFSMTSNANSNIALGTNTLLALTSGKENTAIGAYALGNKTSGMRNAAIGDSSQTNNSTGSYNSSLGYHSFKKSTTSNYNSAMGSFALVDNTSGQWNMAIGDSALSVNTTGSYNTAAGSNANSRTTSFTNSTAIGYNTSIRDSNQIRFGNDSITSIGGYANWSTLSDYQFKDNILEDIPGIDFVNLLRPVSFNYNMNDLTLFLNGGVQNYSQQIINLFNSEKSNIKYSGFIAQEVETASNSIGYDFSGVIAPNNQDDVYNLSYSTFVVVLVQTIKQQQQELQNLKNQLEQIKSINDQLKNEFVKKK